MNGLKASSFIGDLSMGWEAAPLSNHHN